MPQYPYDDPSAQPMQTAPQRDEELLQLMHGNVSEAAERVTFHNCEAERWRRIGVAASLAIDALQSADPVGQTTPDDFSAKVKTTGIAAADYYYDPAPR